MKQGNNGKGGGVVRLALGRAGTRVGFVVLVMVAGSLWLSTGLGLAAPGAHVAKRHSLRVDDQATLHLTRKSGSTLYESGTATGSLPGTITAVFHTSVAKVTGTVTFHSSGGGSVTVTALGYPQSAGRIARFSGSIAVASGTGRFKHALGSGTFGGTVNRGSWAVSVHAVANMTY